MTNRSATTLAGLLLLGGLLVMAGGSRTAGAQVGAPAAAAPAQGTKRSPVDGMEQLYLPAGSFLMGAQGDPDAARDETPQREVRLEGFWIDRTEVTNAMFDRFVRATGHRTVAERNGFSYGFVGGQFQAIAGASWRQPLGPGSGLAGQESHPVVTIGWQDAADYCRWAGRRLPSEAEWERAARGQSGRLFPWGAEAPGGGRANFADRRSGLGWADTAVDDGYERTAPVGAFPGGASPAGTLDMAGNAWEWVADWYDAEAYRNGPAVNPRGPAGGRSRVIRGGSYADDRKNLRSSRRTFDDTAHTSLESGFRCAQAERRVDRFLPLVGRAPSSTPTPPPSPTPTPLPFRSPTPTVTTTPPIGVDPCDPIPGADYQGIRTNDENDGRPVDSHPDINLTVRGWQPTTALLGLVDLTGPTDDRAPRLYGLLPNRYGPHRATITSVYRVHDWVWSRMQRGALLGRWEVTLMGLAASRGETVHVPWADYDMGTLAERLAAQWPGDRAPRPGGRAPAGLAAGYQVLVQYAAPERITLKYTREDNMAEGYGLHLEGICVEPRLLALYERLNGAGRANLPALRSGQPFGRARGAEILVAVRDSGEFMDPRSRKDWWR